MDEPIQEDGAQPNLNRRNLIVGIVAVVGIVAILCGGYAVNKRMSSRDTDTITDPAMGVTPATVATTTIDTSDRIVEIALETLYGERGTDVDSVVGTTTAGKKVVLIENTRTSLPGLKPYETMYPISFSTTTQQIFLGVYHAETDASVGKMYRYDIGSNVFTELSQARAYLDGWRGPNPKSISPDRSCFLSIRGAQLYLVDMKTDKIILLKQLSDGESFVRTNQNFGGYDEGDNEWLSNTKIQFSIFDPVRMDEREPSNHVLLRKEQVEI